MADIVPIADGVSGFINARLNIVQRDTGTAAPNDDSIRSAMLVGDGALQLLSFYFSDVDNNELFPTPPGTVACAFQANAVGDTSVATIGSTGIVFNGGGNDKGWLHVLRRGTLKVGSTTSEAPVAKGTAGYVDPHRSIYFNHKHATPDTVTSGRVGWKLGLKLQIIPFATTAASDRWTATTSGYLKGLVAVAWQANVATDQVAVTLDAAGDVIFTSAAGAAEPGWLWAWSR